MEQTTNPASRVLGILKQARGAAGGTIIDMWCSVFGIPTSDLPGLYRMLVATQELVMEMEARVRQQPMVNHDLYLGSTPTMKKALAMRSLEGSCQGVQILLTPDLFKELEFCDDLLSKTDSEEAVPQDDLRWIQDEIGSLFEEVNASGLPRSLRNPLLELLEAMRAAIATYRIRGASAFRKALATGLGEIILLHTEFGEKKDEPVVRHTKSFLLRLDGIVSKALKYRPLLEAAWPHLPSLLGGP